MADMSFWQEMWGVARDSSRVSATLVGVGAGSMALARWGWDYYSYSSENFRRRCVFEGVSFREPEDPTKPIIVRFKSHGEERDLKEVIGMRTLERRIAKATRRTENGILCLKSGKDHRRMMEIFEDALTGNEPQGNTAEIKGRRVHDDEVAFMPTFYREDDEGSMIRIFIVDIDMLPKLRDPDYFARLKTHRKRHNPRLGMLKSMAEFAPSDADAWDTYVSGDRAVVWKTEIASVWTAGS